MNFIAAKKSFPRNHWHKLPLSHYLMAKHSHRPPPMMHFALLCRRLRKRRQQKERKKKKTNKRAHVWQACTSVDRSSFCFFTAKMKRRRAPAWSDDSELPAQLLMNEVWIRTSHYFVFSSSKLSSLKGSHCASKI